MTVRHAAQLPQLSIAAKLYCVAALCAIAIVVLAAAAIHFAEVTTIAARDLYERGFVGVESSARLETLLEQHRRVVEGTPAEFDRTRLAKRSRILQELNPQIEYLVTSSAANTGEAAQQLSAQVSGKIPNLIALSQQVLLYADSFAQDQAQEAADDYIQVAESIQTQINAYRAERLKVAHGEITNLSRGSRSLTQWVWVCGLCAIFFVGPLGLMITRGVLARLGRITGAMTQLAQHDTTVAVPCGGDKDEVGNMARAVEVFKANAIELLHRKAEVEELNVNILALNNMTHGLCMFNSAERLVICNERYLKMYRIPPELAQAGTHLRDILKHRIKSGSYTTFNMEELIAVSAAVSAKREPTMFTEELTDGRIMAISHQSMADGGWVALHEDITERRLLEAQVTHLARHDALTNLPNRVVFRENMEQAFARVKRGESFAVLCMDLDHFKHVNDTLGHPIGDALLKSVADRMRGCVRSADIVARLGGDEFAIIQARTENAEHAVMLATRLIEAVGKPYDLDGHQVVVGASVGIALAPADAREPDQLLKNADMALYRAKAEGRGICRLFEPDMDLRMQARRTLELDLRNALVRGEFELCYQPVVSLQENRVSGFEALLRWNHPERGRVGPSDFIALAEETGLIVPIGEWVLRQACMEAAKWPQDVIVSVNLSPVQFKRGQIVPLVISALSASGLAARRLELEITELVVMANSDATKTILHQLHDLGVSISMDDFGTGYSSLSYLRTFPFDKIKLDQSFVRDMSKRSDCAAIVRAVADLAVGMNMVAVAEGVENTQQLDLVREAGINEVQGYLFSLPRPGNEVTKMLAEYKSNSQQAA